MTTTHRLLRLALASIVALAAGCTTERAQTVPVVSTAPVAKPDTSAAPDARDDGAQHVEVSSTTAPAAELPKFVSSTPELARFHAALNQLERKQRKDHVRILWLGDSHGQADFWSGQLRKSLGERFGKGGPGFVHLGYKNY